MAGGETSNIAQMAERLSSEIFSEFGWAVSGPLNENFACTSPSAHDREKHPCDTVFHFDDPYSAARHHLLFDLKSFAAGSIKAGQLTGALDSLVTAVECASRSEEWRSRYTSRGTTIAVHGCLFVYNHDGEYRGDFDGLLRVAMKDVKSDLPRGRRLFVVGPDEVQYLATVALDMRQLRGSSRDSLPSREFCYYNYPEPVRARRRDARHKQASIEWLLGPWIVLSHEQVTVGDTIARGHVVYYRHPGRSADEFLYLIDYLFRAGLLDDAGSVVRIRMPNAHGDAVAYFDRARDEYAGSFAQSAGFRKYIEERLAPVRCEPVPNVIRQFSSIEIGMKRHE